MSPTVKIKVYRDRTPEEIHRGMQESLRRSKVLGQQKEDILSLIDADKSTEYLRDIDGRMKKRFIGKGSDGLMVIYILKRDIGDGSMKLDKGYAYPNQIEHNWALTLRDAELPLYTYLVGSGKSMAGQVIKRRLEGTLKEIPFNQHFHEKLESLRRKSKRLQSVHKFYKEELERLLIEASQEKDDTLSNIGHVYALDINGYRYHFSGRRLEPEVIVYAYN